MCGRFTSFRESNQPNSGESADTRLNFEKSMLPKVDSLDAGEKSGPQVEKSAVAGALPAALQDAREDHSLNPLALPATAVVALFFLLAVVTWPPLAEKAVSLDWKIGDLRSKLHLAQAVFGLLTLAALLARKWINAFWAKIFPTRRQLLFGAIALSMSSLLTLIATEAAMRLFHLPFGAKWSLSENALGQFDPDVGWVYIPGKSAVQPFAADNRWIAMHFNELGFRVRDPGVRLDPSAPTVFFVGCSVTMGQGVTYEDSFAGQLERMPEFPFQAVNLGVQGFGTDQALLLLKRHFRRFNTKAVVYTFLPDHVYRNDVADRRLYLLGARYAGTKPLFALTQAGALYLKERPVQSEQQQYSRIGACFRILLTRHGPRPSLDLTRALVQEMRDFTTQNGARFLLVTWPEGPAAGRRAEMCRRAEGLFREMNIEVIAFGGNPPPTWRTWTLPGDLHPGPQGHHLIAQRILEASKKWVDVRDSLPSHTSFNPEASSTQANPTRSGPAGSRGAR